MACNKQFNWLNREHLCQQCLAPFCDNCSSRRVDRGTGSAERVCDACAVCPQCSQNDPSERALEFLHDVGAVLYFGGGDDASKVAHVKDFVVLSPQMRGLVDTSVVTVEAGCTTTTCKCLDGVSNLVILTLLLLFW